MLLYQVREVWNADMAAKLKDSSSQMIPVMTEKIVQEMADKVQKNKNFDQPSKLSRFKKFLVGTCSIYGFILD